MRALSSLTCHPSQFYGESPAEGLLDKPAEQDGAIDVVVLAGLESHRYAAIDNVERPMARHLAFVDPDFLAQHIAVGVRR